MLLQAQGHVCPTLTAKQSVGVKSAFTGNKLRLQHSLNSQRHQRTSFKPCASATVASRETVTSKVSDARLKELGIQDLGEDKWNRSYYPRLQDTVAVHKPWYLIDAEGQTLGRLAVLAATVLRGKDQPSYSPSMDMGAYVLIINAEKVAVTGKKYHQKLYRRHPTSQPGTLKTETFRDLQQRIPERIVEKAIRGMLPKNRLGRHLFTHLKVFKGTRHPHQAQQAIDITSRINQKFNGTAAVATAD